MGELLLSARKDKTFTRVELAKLCKIGVNSIVRYEKAGIDPDDGQYPPARRLASLCYHLDIPMSEAFWSCLSTEDFAEIQMDAFPDLLDHPEHAYLLDQYTKLIKDNHFLKEALKLILELGERREFDRDTQHWLVSKLKKQFDRMDDFEGRMLQLGAAEFRMTNTIGYPAHDPTAWKLDIALSGNLKSREEFPAANYVWGTRRQLQSALENIDRLFPSISSMSRDQVWNLALSFKESPEDDLPSPPSPEIDES